MNVPPEVGILWEDSPDTHTTIMLFPANEITERGARLLEETGRRRQLARLATAQQGQDGQQARHGP